MTDGQFWATVAAAFIGTGVFVSIVYGSSLAASAILRRRRPEPAHAPKSAPVPVDEPVDEVKLRLASSPLPGNHRLVAPPTIEGVTLFAYLRHYAPAPSGLAWDSADGGALARVTEQLYREIERDVRLAPVFHGYDMDGLRRHFTRFLVELTSRGLTVRSADRLQEAHAHLDITGEQFDVVIGYFAASLQAHLQPQTYEHVLPQLLPAVGELRKRMVVSQPAAG